MKMIFTEFTLFSEIGEQEIKVQSDIEGITLKFCEDNEDINLAPKLYLNADDIDSLIVMLQKAKQDQNERKA